MSDIPILFSTPMVRALIDGRKTMTRRIVKPQPERTPTGGWHIRGCGGGCFLASDSTEEEVAREQAQYSRWQSGDRLWVREAWRVWGEYNGLPPSKIPSGSDVQYVADDPLSPWISRFRSSIHMPRWASRLTLIVTGVKIERLQGISDEDAKAEGCGLYVPAHGFITQDDLAEGYSNYLSPRMGFETVWTEINGVESWNANSWVVAVSFVVHKCNIDRMAA